MKRIARPTALITVSLALTACDFGNGRYDLVVDSSLSTTAYRLDTKTGEVVLITGHPMENERFITRVLVDGEDAGKAYKYNLPKDYDADP